MQLKFKKIGGFFDAPPSYSLRIGHLLIEFHRSNSNSHGPKMTMCVKGGRVINLKRANGNRGTGHAFRFIKYWSSGAWWHLDLFWNRHHVK